MKQFLFLLLLTIGMTSCSKDNLINDDLPEGAIGFSDAMLSRGTPVENADDILSMGVLCSLTEGIFANFSSDPVNYMNNVKVSRKDAATPFSYSPLRYWPLEENKYLSFHAYSPHSSTLPDGTLSFVTTGGVPKMIYTVPTDVTAQPDLMLAISQTNKTKAVGRIAFNMKHVLTSVGFKIAGQGEKVTSVKISGVSTVGTISMTGVSIIWTDLNTPQTTVFTAGTKTETEATDVLTDIMKGDGYLMMIPQTLGSNAKLTVSFSDFPDIEVSLNSKTWTPGDKITYELDVPIRIIYDANGGTGAPAIQRVGQDGSVALETKPTGLPANKVLFHSWNTKPDGTGDTYIPGRRITPTGSMILYAMWMGVEKVGRFAGNLTKTTSGDIDTWQYDRVLEVLDMISPERLQWSLADNELTNINDMIDGKSNTWSLQQRSATNYPAANYSFGLNSPVPSSRDNVEWYLPSQKQLLGVWIVNAKLTLTLNPGLNWSSTEENSGNPWYVVVKNGDMGAAHVKNELYYVRTVRDVAPK